MRVDAMNAAPVSQAGTIESVICVPVAIPLRSPVRWSTREVAAREHVLVFIASDQGVEGVGWTYAGARAARSMAMFIDDVITPLLVGRPLVALERIWSELFQESLLLGRRGMALRAMSAIDIALWDVLGKVANLPLYQLLGGFRSEVPCYASGGYYRPGDPLENVEKEIGRYLELGFSDTKIKVGGLEPSVDAERVRVARELIGPRGRLALDANNAWRSVNTALRFLALVEKYEPWWIEEPFPPDDIAAHAELARRTSVPVATGEIHSTRWDFRPIIEQRAASILQTDATVVGGVSEWLKVAHAASLFDLQMAPHWNVDIHVHLAAAVTNCLTVEYFVLEQDITNFERLLAEPLRPTAGSIRLPDRPGVGLVLDRGSVDRYRLDR